MTAFHWRRIFGSNGRRGGFLARLRRDQRGNTLALMAAALIPMIGMVGSAVDISRAYLVKTRLQQACDAGVLAARRTMTGQSVESDTNAQTQATNFFNINLKAGAYGATITPITVTDVKANNVATGVVHGVASADVPTTLMKIFGKTKLTMQATCEAQLQVSNNDVMFVLDTTGSMNCSASDTQATCSDNGLVEKTDARIKALRTAVTSFYSTLSAATTSGSQLRIGFVPYSTTVNVGGVLPAAYIADSWTYQSRVANFNTSFTQATAGSPVVTTEQYPSNITSANCNNYGINKYPTATGTNPVNSGTAPANTTSVTYSFNKWTKVSGSGSSALGTCVRNKSTVTTTYATRYKFTDWTVKPVSYNTSAFKAGTSIPVIMSPSSASYASTAPTPSSSLSFATQTSLNEADLAAADNTLTSTSTTWGGCIEERQTTPGATTFSPAPNDLNIDLVPASDPNTQWKPWWPEIIWGWNNYLNSFHGAVGQIATLPSQVGSVSMRNWFACPKAAQKLTTTDATAVSNYVNASDFKAVGFTYHDTGMLWGLRLMSPTGLFATENTTSPNGKPINRHIVFMTDGDMEPDATSYNMYGHEYEDKRVSGSTGTSSTNLTSLHNARFLAICQKAKDLNITIWVIAYAQTMTTQLQTCASPGKAFYAGSDAALQTVFQTIANQIAQLRLSA